MRALNDRHRRDQWLYRQGGHASPPGEPPHLLTVICRDLMHRLYVNGHDMATYQRLRDDAIKTLKAST